MTEGGGTCAQGNWVPPGSPWGPSSLKSDSFEIPALPDAWRAVGDRNMEDDDSDPAPVDINAPGGGVKVRTDPWDRMG